MWIETSKGKFTLVWDHRTQSTVTVLGSLRSPPDIRRVTVCRIYPGHLSAEQRKNDFLGFTRGLAVCHPVDRFNKRIGRKRALKSAISNLPKRVRAEIWKQVLERTR